MRHKHTSGVLLDKKHGACDTMSKDDAGATTPILVYGDFLEPTMGKNYIIVFVPSGRIPWSKKIAPAIDRLVQSFVPKPIRAAYKRPKHVLNSDGSGITYSWTRERRQKASWSVDNYDVPGETKTTVRYAWSGTNLVKIG